MNKFMNKCTMRGPRVTISRSPKDKIVEMHTPGVIHFSFRKSSYIGQTGRAIEVRIKRHQKYVIYKGTDKLAVAEHVDKNKEDYIGFNEIKILNNNKIM